jgi:hypothetical protein
LLIWKVGKLESRSSPNKLNNLINLIFAEPVEALALSLSKRQPNQLNHHINQFTNLMYMFQMMKSTFAILYIILLFCTKGICQTTVSDDLKMGSLMENMTLQEKIGQLNFYIGETEKNLKPQNAQPLDQYDDLVKSGMVAGFSNVYGVENIRRLQKTGRGKIAVQNSFALCC